jgi:hypothetical protein
VSRTTYFDLLSRTKYLELLESIALLLGEWRQVRPSHGLDAAPNIIKEMQWVGMFSRKFREQNAPELNELLNDMYIELNDDTQ